MFNFARHRHNPVPKQYQQEQLVFESKPIDQKLQEDALSLAQTMVRHGLKKPEDAYALQDVGVEYWQFINEFHPDYKEKVFQKAELLAEQLGSDFRVHPEMFPMPAPPQPGGGGAGAPPPGGGAMAAFVLPDGRILVKRGSTYSVNVGNETLFFSADENDAFQTAMTKIAARESKHMTGKILEG